MECIQDDNSIKPHREIMKITPARTGRRGNRTTWATALLLLAFLVSSSCAREEWEEHYNGQEEQVDMHLWDAVRQEPRYSEFVKFMEETLLDSLFELDQVYTLFIPDNDAFANLGDTAGTLGITMANHVSRTVLQTGNIAESRKLQVINGKFAIIDRSASGYMFEETPIEYSSPLYLDGKYYEIADIAYPRPNLYEYAALFSPVIREFIDGTDSVYLDKSLSTPLSFDQNGNTIYDSVFSVVNTFERDFFPVSREFRNLAATFILFNQDQYQQALDEMAGLLGPDFTGHEDIPDKWQFEVLLPDAMSKSLFDNDLEYDQLNPVMISVTGDTVEINPANINPDSKYRASNGTIYTYYEYSVPEDLFLGEQLIEGEEFVDSIGAGRYAWNEMVSLCGENPYIAEPIRQFSRNASLDRFVSVTLPRDFDGEYCFEFSFKNLFPMRYRLEWHANYRPSGYYAVYVNDQLVGEIDTYDLRRSVLSVTGERFLPTEGFNSVDWWVENVTGFGDVTVRFEYLNSGLSSTNGFNIDYVKLVPSPEQ